jgi:hypothetical protein
MSTRTISNYNRRQQAHTMSRAAYADYLNKIEATIAEQDEEEDLLNHVLLVMAWTHIPRVFTKCPCCGAYEPSAAELLTSDPEFIKWVCGIDVISAVRKYGREFYGNDR